MATLLTPEVEFGLREPAPRPPVTARFSAQSPSQIVIRHPGYKSSRLIDLPAFDGGEDCPGIHHGTVLLICGFFADNTFDGWLSLTRGGDRLGLGGDDLLPVGEYYLPIPWPAELRTEGQQGVYKWPIIPTFRLWPFPHSNLPPPQLFPRNPFSDQTSIPISLRSNASQTVKARDGGCCMSPDQDGVEGAHIVPEGEDEWFREQEMDQYNPISWMTGAKPVNNPSNMLTLRADIHIVYDTKSFIFTWKLGSWRSHFLTSTANLGFEYHNRRVKMPVDVHPNFLLARVAWTVFPMIQNFFSRGESRVVRVGLEDKEMTSHALRDTFFPRTRNSSPTKSRGHSPQKRKRDGADNEDMEVSGAVSQRPRLEIDRSLHPNKEPVFENPPAATPDLLDCETNSENSRMPVYLPEKNCTDLHTWDQHITTLRHQALIDQRKNNASLMCCDYNMAEQEIAAGMEGPKMYGGAHVCMRCMGVEFRDEIT
jgi:hypothetical protein